MNKSDDILSAARLCLQNGHLSAAAVLCGYRLQEDPADVGAYQLAGVVACGLTDFVAARQHFENAVSRSPHDATLLYNLGTAHHQLNEFAAAISCYQSAIALRNNYAQAHNNLGHALMKTGRFSEAARHLELAIQLDSRYAEAHNNLGLVLAAQCLWQDAAHKYNMALSLNSDLSDAYRNLGVALQQLGDQDGAEACFRKAVEQFPNCATTRVNYVTVLMNLQRWNEALAQCDAATNIAPSEFLPCYLRGNILRQQGDRRRAAVEYRRALELRSDSAETHNNLAVTLVEDGHCAEAEQHCREAIAIRNDYPEAWSNLGECLRRQGKWLEAQKCLRRALELRPEYADAENNLAAALIGNSEIDEAAVVLRKLLRRCPEHADALCNLGLFHAISGDWPTAELHYRNALEHNAELAEAHMNLALLLLVHGDLAQGWREYAWRWKTHERPRITALPQPGWQGEKMPQGTVLLRSEQGLGDTIQFVRYAPLVKQLVHTVLVECPPRMAPLLATCVGVDGCVTAHPAEHTWDMQAALLDLPRILQTTLSNIPARVPYLQSNPERVERWRGYFQQRTEICIGIAWQGNPQFRWDRWRSIPLTAFAPLARTPQIKLFSLQTGLGTEQINQVDFDVNALAQQFDEVDSAFADTAAVIQHLDLVITSDTSIAHLAGALGAPVWLALSSYPDWRWMLERADSPWYPTLRLFRQQRGEPWLKVFAGMASEIQQLRAQGLFRRSV